jgi:hypothetical protein
MNSLHSKMSKHRKLGHQVRRVVLKKIHNRARHMAQTQRLMSVLQMTTVSRSTRLSLPQSTTSCSKRLHIFRKDPNQSATRSQCHQLSGRMLDTSSQTSAQRWLDVRRASESSFDCDEDVLLKVEQVPTLWAHFILSTHRSMVPFLK